MVNLTASEVVALYQWARASQDPAVLRPVLMFESLLCLDLTDYCWWCQSARADLVGHLIARLAVLQESGRSVTVR